MNNEKKFFNTVCRFAIPVALQSMLQTSFSMVDQIMIGQLGEVNVAGVGLAGKFSSIYSVLVSAIGAVAGIMISQYMGQKKTKNIRKSFGLNLGLALSVAAIFLSVCLLLPNGIMRLYAKDTITVQAAADYLVILAGTFLPMAGSTLFAVLFRCMEKAMLPLYATIASAFLNTALNYILIFGKFGCKPMGVKGAAIATLISQIVNFLVMLVLFFKNQACIQMEEEEKTEESILSKRQYIRMLLPILVCELMWVLGENVYAAIYGHLGTEACAAMTLINPVQGIMIGALCGLSQAAGVIIGKLLGQKEYEEAYSASKRLICYGFCGSVCLSVLIVLLRSFYVEIYQVEAVVKQLTEQILLAYAIVAPFKVQNMILGGGIIRSGGKTNYVMAIDIIGTWCFGVPLGLLSAFVWKLSIPYVYFMLSLEECIRLGISFVVFKKRRWMRNLAEEE